MEVAGKRLETDNVAEFCESCATENLSKPADGFCTDCNEFMCQECFKHHLKGKLCRNHVLDSLNGASSQGTQRIQEENCKKHAKETVKFYCRTHNAVGCGDCIVSEHQKCDTEFIKVLAKNYEESSEFKTRLRQIQKWESDKAEDEAHIETNRKENKTLLDNAIKDIRNFRRTINNWLDNMEKRLEDDVRSIYKDNEKKMSLLEERIKNISSEIDSIKEQLDSNIYHADNLFIRHVENQNRMDHVDKTLSEIKPANVIKEYTFEPETQVKDMFKSWIKIGMLRVKREMMTEREQPTEGESSADTIIKVKREIQTEKKPSTDFASSATTNVYQLPDPRAAGLSVGKRVQAAWIGYRHQGTVISVEASGYVSVKWDAGGTGRYQTHKLKLLYMYM